MNIMRLLPLAGVILISLTSSQATQGCDFPPSVWCSSLEIATQCKVVEQCLDQTWTRSTNAKPVDFTLYYESLCPDCKEFFSSQLIPTFTKLMDTGIFNLTLVPYGNAMETKQEGKWVFTCQHGVEECVGNIIETCAISIVKSIQKYFPFIRCIEQSTESPSSISKKCASMYQLDYNAIMMCANGTLGNELEHQMAVKTNNLNPPHDWVPWVTLNGVHNDEIQQQATSNLLKLICDTYKGPQPDACKTKGQHSLRT